MRLPLHMRPPTGYVGVYHIERLYGGPEEGGWYWDCWYHCFSVPCWGDEEQQLQRLRQQLEQPEYELHSVLSDGLPQLRLESEAGEFRSIEKPVYC